MDDDIFEVGLPVSVETDYKYYLTTRMIGWERDLFIITGIVHSAGKSVPLKVNDLCKMRFLKDGIAYGFETKVLAINLQPYPLTFFKFPMAVERFTIRKFNRIKSNYPAQLLDKNGEFIAEAIITNISAGGCGLNIPVQEGKELAYENTYEIFFSILETDMRLCCSIRKMRTVKGTRMLGIEFINISAAEKEMIHVFLDICTNTFTSKLDLILAKMKTSGEILGGQIEELSLTDMLQIFDELKKEGVIYVTTGQRNGSIAISKGQIMDAFMDDIQGEDALSELLSLKEGEFHFFAKEIASGHIKRPINFILVDTCRLIDERDSLGEDFPDNENILVLLKEPVTEDHEIKTVINALRNGASTVQELNAATGLSLIRSGLISARLLKEGYLTKMP